MHWKGEREVAFVSGKGGFMKRKKCVTMKRVFKRRRIEGENGAVVDLNSVTMTWTIFQSFLL